MNMRRGHKELPCTIGITENEITFTFKIDSLKQLGISRQEMIDVLDKGGWSPLYDVVLTIVSGGMEPIKQDYSNNFSSVNWKNWDWCVEFNPRNHDYVDFVYVNCSDAITSAELKEMLGDMYEELGYDIPEDTDDAGYSLTDSNNSDDEDHVYAVIAKDMDTILMVAQFLMMFGIVESSLYRNNAGEYVLNIEEDMKMNVRLAITNVLPAEYNVDFLGKSLSEIGKAYADEHDTYIIRSNAIDKIIDQFM